MLDDVYIFFLNALVFCTKQFRFFIQEFSEVSENGKRKALLGSRRRVFIANGRAMHHRLTLGLSS